MCEYCKRLYLILGRMLGDNSPVADVIQRKFVAEIHQGTNNESLAP